MVLKILHLSDISLVSVQLISRNTLRCFNLQNSVLYTSHEWEHVSCPATVCKLSRRECAWVCVYACVCALSSTYAAPCCCSHPRAAHVRSRAKLHVIRLSSLSEFSHLQKRHTASLQTNPPFLKISNSLPENKWRGNGIEWGTLIRALHFF